MVLRLFLLGSVTLCGLHASTALAVPLGDLLWNIRTEHKDYFHSNEATVRPWATNVDNGQGQFEGNYSYIINWSPPTTTGNGSGGFNLGGQRDLQFSAWTFVFLKEPGQISLVVDGDCVPVAYADFPTNTTYGLPYNPAYSPTLSAGWHRIDVTGYNQNDGYNFVANLSGVDVINSTIIPEPAAAAPFLLVTATLLRPRRQ